MSIDHSSVTDHVDIEEFEVWPQTRTWGTEVLIGHAAGYTGKVLVMMAGTRGGLQKHSVKDETFYVHEGRCFVDHDPGDGVIRRIEAGPGQAFHIPPGAVHRVEAITNCLLFEVSNPVFGDRENVSHLYGEESDSQLPDEGPKYEP